jgi:hypothetical protein
MMPEELQLLPEFIGREQATQMQMNIFIWNLLGKPSFVGPAGLRGASGCFATRATR